MNITIPSLYDFRPFLFTLDAAVNSMNTDGRHIDALYAMVKDQDMPLNVVEIGSFRGMSASAFVAAINEGSAINLTCIDPFITDELERVIAMAPDGRAKIMRAQSTDAALLETIQKADILFVDGNHEWPALYEILAAVAAEVPVIAMHDTHSWPKLDDCYGSHLAGKLLKSAALWDWYCDALPREGEHTWRGFAIACPMERPEFWAAISAIENYRPKYAE